MGQAVPQVCHLSHAGFRMLGEPVFRLSEGTRVPSMVVQIESHDAVLPLQSLAREFKIEPESGDGQMLKLIELALDFVVALRIGDTLPSEVSGGEASWKPTEQDRRIAASKVAYNLVRCAFVRMGQPVPPGVSSNPGWEESAASQAVLRQAVDGAVTLLHGPEAAEVIARISAITEEMACIETMRRTLMKGITKPQEKLIRLQMTDVPVSRRETVKQVQSLTKRGLKEITQRFDDVEAKLDDMLGMLREIDSAVAWLRRQRDWLFRTNHAWEPVFNDWGNAPNNFDDFYWKVVERSYSFLAPRFMSYQEWTSTIAKPKKEDMKVKVW